MNKDKKFINPEANIIEFLVEDIIVTSGDPWDDNNEVGGTTGGQVPSPSPWW